MKMNNWPLMKDNLTLLDRVRMASFCLLSNRFTNGPKVREFEKAWSEWVGADYSLYVSLAARQTFIVGIGKRILWTQGWR